jgi:3-hydroxyacyl-[acyl-carrier-protein] dehydratase
MPPQLLFDLSGIDLSHVVYSQDSIRENNPQRGAMEHLNSIVYVNGELGRIIGCKEVGTDEFWVDGHIPGRPLLPGVIMIEAGAQLASFYTKKVMGWTGFIGFGGVEDCKFRQQVVPGDRMYILGQKIWERHRRVGCKVQGIVNGSMAFEATIVGAQF